MEIKFLDVSVKSLVNHVNLTINSKQITGIFQDNNIIIARILLNKVNYTTVSESTKRNFIPFA